MSPFFMPAKNTTVRQSVLQIAWTKTPGDSRLPGGMPSSLANEMIPLVVPKRHRVTGDTRNFGRESLRR